LPDRNELTFIIVGARSGKSAHAETLATALPAPWTYIATAQAYDDEMRERIALHRSRRGEGWTTVDAPLDLAAALEALPDNQPVLVDCLTLWLTNLVFWLVLGAVVGVVRGRFTGTATSLRDSFA